MSEIMRLTYTYDGDTLGARRTLNGADEQVRIRLAYLDAPEIDQGNWGIRARAYLRSLLVINEHIAVQIKGRDDYGRLIAEVLRTRDYGNCGLRLVLGGYVALWQCPATQPAYWAAQDMARDARRGIWAVPGLHQTPLACPMNPSPPDEETAMHDDQDELRRRIERIEQTATDLAMMLRENTLMIARLNDTLAEFKAEIIKVHAIEKDLSNLAFGFSALKWLATAIGGSAVVLIMAYLFKGQAI